MFQLAVCKLFCPLTGGTPEGIEECQAQHCPKEDNQERQAKSDSSVSDRVDIVDADESPVDDDEVEVFKVVETESEEKRQARADLKSIEAEIDADEKELKKKLLKWKKIMAELEEEEE